MTASAPELVLVGGGHSHVIVLERLAKRPVPGARITLVSREAAAPYSGMLPGFVAGHYRFEEAHIHLPPLARAAGARFVHDEVVGLDLESGRVLLRGGEPIPWDVLCLDVGSSPSVDEVPGARQEAIPVKPVDRFAARLETLLRRLEAPRPVALGVVGGGAAGVELVLSLRHRLLAARGGPSDDTDLAFHLVSAAPEILPGHNRRVRAKLGSILRERGIAVHAARKVERVERVEREGGTRRRLRFEGGGALDLDEVLWATHAVAARWPGEAGLAVDPEGFVRVAPTLASVSHPKVFAAGDIAAVEGFPRPKSGVFAVRQGPPLAENLRRRLLGRPLVPFAPQERALSLISTGDRRAVASRGGWALEGAWVWRWKDWIDRRFVERFRAGSSSGRGEHKAPDSRTSP